MASSTFLNLPPEKRERFLTAAREEFASVSLSGASVNRMIHRAGIPRGSFYMYFTGKEDLFCYLMEEYRKQIETRMTQLLAACSGDLFAAFLALFDHILACSHTGEYRELLDIFRCNPQMQTNLFLHHPPPDHDLRDRVDFSRLDLREPGDLACLISFLVTITAEAVVAADQSGDPDTARKQLVQMYKILQRGAANPAVFHKETE